jgi:hypothetical protein
VLQGFQRDGIHTKEKKLTVEKQATGKVSQIQRDKYKSEDADEEPREVGEEMGGIGHDGKTSSKVSSYDFSNHEDDADD